LAVVAPAIPVTRGRADVAGGSAVLVCFGTRPEVVKLAPVIHELRRQGQAVLTLSTGQHREMLDQMLRAFDIEADTDLDVMRPGQTLGDLTGRMVPALARAIELVRPSAVLVQGDTTTAMCAALAAFYADVPIGHVEAGLRTHDLGDPFPEEGNRRVIAQLADWHYSPTELGRANLRREGISDDSICVTGNTGIDAALWTAHQLGISRTRRPDGRRRILVTMHRRESQGATQRQISRMLVRLANRRDVHVVFPVHWSPAVRASVLPELERHPNVTLCDPLGYHEFIRALASADLVLTDSGGIQEEAPTFDVPVLVMRETTERPEGVSAGCARLCGVDPERIFREATLVLDDPDVRRRMAATPNPYGDGHAAERVVARLVADLGLEVGMRGPLPQGSAEVERLSKTAVLAGGIT
jgi:UDP-N-acetylglucosamine 2-epimerase (non-hydrolysing)